MPQTSVKLDQDVSITGNPVNTRPYDHFTGMSGEADDGLNFGDPVYISIYSERYSEVKKLGTTGTAAPRLDGFVLYDSRMGGVIKNKEHLSIVRKGIIWVKASLFAGAVNAGVSLYYDLSAGKFAGMSAQYDISASSFKVNATLAAGDIAIPGLVLWGALSAAEVTAGTKLVPLEVNLPGLQGVTVA